MLPNLSWEQNPKKPKLKGQKNMMLAHSAFSLLVRGWLLVQALQVSSTNTKRTA